ncbi:ShlB/FhaC/HecB family hemolysin secretion/activation protein [Undibacterium sp. TJN19]|uniref:ShlB/FhaC/HecB family hemolysin secretion/activation protein n=1 Tax=Undibacterium sp. TJN19 TaxID=3413055 RepID=UPI003BF09147
MLLSTQRTICTMAVAASLAYAVPVYAQVTIVSDASPTAFKLPVVQDVLADVNVKEFRFTGNTVITTQVLQDLARPYLGRLVSHAELEELRTHITRLYIAQGYINSGAVLIPAQGNEPYPGGVVPFRLIEGRISQVEIKGEGRLAQQYLRQRLVAEPEVLNMPQLQQRFQLLLTDPLFEKINSRIFPGDVPGMAILDIDVVRAKAYGANIFFNNYRAPSIGAETLGLSAWTRNLTGQGDFLEASVTHSEGADPVHVAWTMPVANTGGSLRLSVDQGSSSVVGESLKAIDIKSRSSGFEAGYAQTLVHSLQRKIELGVSYSQRDSKTSLLGEAFSFTPGEPDGVSKTRVWRFSQDWTERWETQALAARSVFAFGSNNTDHSDPAVSVPDQHYRIWTGQLQYVKNLAKDGAQLILRGSAQQTPDSLLPLERFSLGGVATVRGYRENALVRDRAWLMNAEIHYPFLADAGDGQNLTLISFADIASAWNKDEASQKLASIGVGFNWRWKKWAVDFFLAKKLNTMPGIDSGNLQDHGLHFQITYHLF